MESQLGNKLPDNEGKLASHEIDWPNLSKIVAQEMTPRATEVTTDVEIILETDKVIVKDGQQQQDTARLKSYIILHGLHEPIGETTKNKKIQIVFKTCWTNLKVTQRQSTCVMCIRLGKLAVRSGRKTKTI